MFKRSLLSVVFLLSLSSSVFAAESAEVSRLQSVKDWCANTRVVVGARNAWNSYSESTVGGFLNGMMNPVRYKQACSDMWNAGVKDALPTLWANHKPVIAGTTVAATAALAAYAYCKGWFASAKDKVNEWKEGR